MDQNSEKAAIFIDMDGAIAFRKGAHNVEVIDEVEGGISKIHTGDPSKPIEAHRLASAPENAVYIATETRRLLKALMEDADIYIVSAARPDAIKQRRQFFDFAKGFILQTGGGIYDRDLNRDEAWHDHLASERELIPELMNNLNAIGLNFLDKWEGAAIRIRAKDNPHLSEDEFKELVTNLKLPPGLKLTYNLGHADIILESAGKDKAVEYVMSRDDYKYDQTYGIGDDINDIPMLQKVANRLYIKKRLRKSP